MEFVRRPQISRALPLAESCYALPRVETIRVCVRVCVMVRAGAQTSCLATGVHQFLATLGGEQIETDFC